MTKLLPVMVLALTVAGCLLPSEPSVYQGDADSVEITQAGNIANAWPLARRHCAQFERLPRFIDTDGQTARFDCVRR